MVESKQLNRIAFTQVIYGDGGNAGYDATMPTWRFNEFTSGFSDANFENGDPERWVIISAPIVNSGEAVGFYWPQIGDPNSTLGTHPIFSGAQHVWRSLAFGAGRPGQVPQDTSPDIAGYEANCPEFVAATSAGRIFVTHNADAADPAAVTWHRVDTANSGDSPTRFPSGIYVDPADAGHAWVSYSGYSAATPTKPGHVFEVLENGTSPGSGLFTNLNVESGTLAYPTPASDGDLPVSDVVRDDAGHTLYVSTDFGVLRGDNDVNDATNENG